MKKKKKTRRVYSITGRVEEIEIPQPTLIERIKEVVCIFFGILMVIAFGVIILAAISTTWGGPRL